MHHLSDRIVDLADVLGPEACRLEAQFAEAPDWESCFALADAFVLRRVAGAQPVSRAARHAWWRLNDSGGTVPIAALAAEVHCSRKHLSVRFREEIGLPPKTLARLLRFRRVVERLSAGETVRFSAIALDCGYYDQAHLIRDFRQFAGMMPTAFLRQRLPDGTGTIDDLSLA